MTLINITEFQQKILNCVTSEEINELFELTSFTNDPLCKQAMIHGMTIAAAMAATCTKY